MPTVSYGIANTADDVSYAASFGLDNATVVSAGSGSLFGETVTVGFRFPGVVVPQGATITSATLTLRRDDAPLGPPGGSAWGSMRGVNANTTAAWTTTNPAAASKTSAGVTITTATPNAMNVTAIVQEIVNRAGWASGNVMGFVTDPGSTNGYIVWTDYSTSTTNCAQLSITYDAGGGGINATASITEANDAVTATATVRISASASITEAQDNAAGTARVRISALASIAEANDTVSATVTVAFPAITATASITEDPDTLAAATVLRISVTAAITEGADTVTSTATALIQATATIGESSDTLAATVAVVTGIAASADITEEPDTLSATSTVRITAQAVVNESSDTLEAIVEITATLTGRAIVIIIG